MATEKQIRSALRRKLLGKPNYEDPNRCELHAYILHKLDRWSAPKRFGDWSGKASKLRTRLLQDVYLKGIPQSVLRAPLKDRKSVV